jgi:PAS domain S-box-containing protein
VEESDDFIFEVDYKGQFKYANPLTLKKLGYNEAELKKLNYQSLVPPNRLEEMVQFYSIQYKKKNPTTYAEWEVVNRFGESTFVGLKARMFFDAEGKIQKVRGSARDLSDNKNLAKRNRLFENNIEPFLKALLDPILIFDFGKDSVTKGNTSLLWANKAILEVLGLDWHEIKDLSLQQISSSMFEMVQQGLNHPEKMTFWKTTKGIDRVFRLVARTGPGILWVSMVDLPVAKVGGPSWKNCAITSNITLIGKTIKEHDY